MSTIAVNGSVKKEQDASTLSIPFPKWINRWALFIMGVCIIIPIGLLFFIHQPVYVQAPAQLVEDKNELLFVSNVSSSVAPLNFEGQPVELYISLPTSQKPEKGKGFIHSILLSRDGAQVTIKPEESLQNRLRQLSKENLRSVQASVQLKRAERNMVGKIFN